MRTLATLLFCVLGLASCVGPTLVVQQYKGEVRPRYQVAILRQRGVDTARIATLDGDDVAVPIASDVRLHLEMLPGEHTVSAFDPRDPNRVTPELRFLAEAGRTYRVDVASAEYGHGVLGRVVEIEPDSEREVRDVTATRRERTRDEGASHAAEGGPDGGAEPVRSPE